jgi:hypothetical protein
MKIKGSRCAGCTLWAMAPVQSVLSIISIISYMYIYIYIYIYIYACICMYTWFSLRLGHLSPLICKFFSFFILIQPSCEYA